MKQSAITGLGNRSYDPSRNTSLVRTYLVLVSYNALTNTYFRDHQHFQEDTIFVEVKGFEGSMGLALPDNIIPCYAQYYPYIARIILKLLGKRLLAAVGSQLTC